MYPKRQRLSVAHSVGESHFVGAHRLNFAVEICEKKMRFESKWLIMFEWGYTTGVTGDVLASRKKHQELHVAKSAQYRLETNKRR